MSHKLSRRIQGMEKTLIRRINDMADPACINLGLGEPAFPTPKAILDHVQENLGSWDLGYSPNEGFPELRKLIAEQSGENVSLDQVCVTVGAEEALLDVLMVLVDAGDEVLIPDPGYPAYPSLVRLAGGEPKAYPLSPKDGFALSADRVLSMINERTKAIVVNSPNNPTGAVHRPEELEALARGLRSRSLTVISDEVYRDIVFEAPASSIAAWAGRCVIVNSLSKSLSMPGWRFGWCVAPADIAKAVGTFHQLAVMCVPSLSQRAAVHALRGFADAEKRSNIEELRRRRDFAMACLDRYGHLPYMRPAGALYILLDISGRMARFGDSLGAALKLLAEERVVTIPGSAFGRNSEGFLRLSFAPAPDILEEGIKRIGRFFWSS